MKVSNFDKPSIKAIRTAMDAALAKVSKEYGIKISTGNARFSSDEVTFKVKANVIGTGGVVKTKEAQAWDIYASSQGLGHLNVGDTIQLQGIIQGLESRLLTLPTVMVEGISVQ